MIERLEAIWRRIPEVEYPDRPLSFKEKLMWTLAVLITFYIMGHVPLYGVESVVGESPLAFQTILASNLGTLLTSGIGPIVIASIILQLFAGSGLIPIDLTSEVGRKQFVGLQRILVIIFALFEGFVFTSTGFIKAFPGMELLVALQIALGSIILMYLDDLILKWGIGSGISLFIAANVTKSMFWRGFGIHPESMINGLINSLSTGSALWWTYLVPFIVTLFVILVVVYAEGIKIEIPLAFAAVRGHGFKFPIKLLYLSNLPVILAAALFANIMLWSNLTRGTPLEPILGEYREIEVGGEIRYELVGGLAYYLSPPVNFMDMVFSFVTSGQVPPGFLDEVFRALVYVFLLTLASTFFGRLWIDVSGHSPKDMARQMMQSGLSLPGFRRDPRVLESVLERYIPKVAIMGSAFVGFLAGITDIFRGLETGMGILLTVSIVYRYYEILMREKVFDIYPALRRFFG